MDQFGQVVVDGVELTDVMMMVKIHIEQCKCCRDEYQALLTALRAIE